MRVCMCVCVCECVRACAFACFQLVEAASSFPLCLGLRNCFGHMGIVHLISLPLAIVLLTPMPCSGRFHFVYGGRAGRRWCRQPVRGGHMHGQGERVTEAVTWASYVAARTCMMMAMGSPREVMDNIGRFRGECDCAQCAEGRDGGTPGRTERRALRGSISIIA